MALEDLLNPSEGKHPLKIRLESDACTHRAVALDPLSIENRYRLHTNIGRGLQPPLDPVLASTLGWGGTSSFSRSRDGSPSKAPSDVS